MAATARTTDHDVLMLRVGDGGGGQSRGRRRRRGDLGVLEGRGGGGGGALPFCRVVALGLVVALSVIGETEGSMDISAFEYFRKFGRHLELGECPQRERLITLRNGSTVVKHEACITQRMKGNVTNFPRVHNNTSLVEIPSANSLVAYLGLCGGEAASYLGLLNTGDCIAVDIASKLTFNKKTMVRAYYVYFQKSLDILDTTTSAANADDNADAAALSSRRMREGLQEYYLRDLYYVKHRSYGTVELILVQFRFRSSRQARDARELHVPPATTTLMSEYMKRVEREVGKPRRVMVLTLSTATEAGFKVSRYSPMQWGSAVRDVQLRENVVERTRQLISMGSIRPNLNYQLFPFVPEQGQSSRSSSLSTQTWQEVSMLEVSLRVSVAAAKKSPDRYGPSLSVSGSLCVLSMQSVLSFFSSSSSAVGRLRAHTHTHTHWHARTPHTHLRACTHIDTHLHVRAVVE
ncbi:uncharacterized protein LOC143275498 [Babylonia areolata]|uniref:uncharacterized protein LOC143275498 n=1 Tax=Babylonia areolata TaxID=304850 RepID=UPI003FD378F3